jgi:putative hemolysin
MSDLCLKIAALVLFGGFFVLFEEALKAARIPRLKKFAADAEVSGTSRKGEKYRRLEKAVEFPGKYYAAARIWICILRTLATALAVLGTGSTDRLLPLAISFSALVLSFLLVGDRLPRLIAHSSPERIAAVLFPLFRLLALPLTPLFYLARFTGEKVRTAFLAKSSQGITEDELLNALIEGEKSGIVESKERTMVEGVFYLGDKQLGAFMTHRSEVQWLDSTAAASDIHEKALKYRQQRCFPVTNGTLDSVIGAAYLEDIILDLASDSPAGLQAVMKKALFVPETMPALKAFESFKQGEADFLFVMDEYGGFAGMVSVRSLMEEIVKELAEPAGEDEQAVEQEDGSWITGGALDIDDAAELLSMPSLAASDDYHTLAGFVLSLAGELPSVGDSFVYQNHRFTVLDMEGNRIGKIEIRRMGEQE